MKRGFTFLLLFLVLIISASVIFASFEVGDLSHSINKEYGLSDYIQGWINISLTNEPANSLFETNFEDSITLVNLLKLNDATQDACVPQDCTSDYSASEASKIKTFSLESKESKIIGVKLEGDIERINSIGFTFESNAIPSCYNQLGVDFLNNGIVDIQNEKVLDSECFSEDYGCFNDAQSTQEGKIETTPYCQKIRLYNFPGFRLGAWIKEIIQGENILKMALYDGNQEVAFCNLPKTNISSGGGKVYCDIDYLVKEPKDYYVCIYSDGGDGTYHIKGYPNSQTGCGFFGWPSRPATSAYNIFAQGKRFAEVGSLNVTNDLFPGESLETLAEQYLRMKYGDEMNCPEEGCIIPIKFLAEERQSITTENLLVNYDTVSFGGITEKNFSDLTESSAMVNIDFQKLYLDGANFSVPNEYGEKTFVLTLNGTEIFSEKISIEKIPIIKRLIPTATASAFPTEFKVIVEEFANVTKYEWHFGDGKSKITTTNTVTHTYSAGGQYKLNITVTDLNQRSALKTFDVTVGSPEEIVNDMLGKMLNDLKNIKIEISKFEAFSQDSINSFLDVDSLNTKMAEIQVANASTSPDYEAILTTLLGLVEKIPESIIKSESSDLISFYPDKSIINLDILKIIGGGSYDASKEDKYLDAVLSWNQQHMDTKISVEGFSGKYGQLEEPLLKVFNLKIKKKSGLDYNPYLIFLDLDELKFKEKYSETEESGYIFIDLTEGDKTISFSTTEDISFIDLPVFISPEISKLGVVEPSIFGKEGKGWKWALFILIASLLILVGIVVYIILQIWYKKKYENYLFKNKNELYNLITYVQNARKKGLKKQEIADKLSKIGWSSERIKYILKKYAGKRTGMFEIPVENVLTKFKKKTNQPDSKLGRSLHHRPAPNHNRRAILGHKRVKGRKFFKK